jgi:EmrB/QacA subfamily drug resistance transporter
MTVLGTLTHGPGRAWRERGRSHHLLAGRRAVTVVDQPRDRAAVVPPRRNDGMARQGVGATPSPSGDGRHRRPSSRWVIFAIVSIALFMSSVDATIVATGLPTLSRDLHAHLNWASWTMIGYQLGLVVAMPVAGRVADQLGRKRVFIAAATLFTTASLLCGLTNSVNVLIGLRVLQAVGGAAFMPSASGIVVEAFGRNRNRALGMFSSVFPLGALVGPIIGGIIITDWSWRGIFLVNVPIGVIFTLLAIRYLPSAKAPGGRPDLIGAGLLGGAILGCMLAITHLGDTGSQVLSIGFVGPLAVSVVAGWGFMHRSSRTDEPLIALHLLRGRVFGAMNAVNFVWGACAIGFGSLVPLFAEERYGLTPLAAGTLLTARALGEIGLAVCASMLLNRTGYRMPMIGGFSCIAAGLVLIAVHPAVLSPYGWLAASAALTGIGIGLSAPASNNASLDMAPDDVGSITGLRGASRQAGAIIGVALTTSVVARSSDQAATLGHSFFVLGGLLLLITPLVFLVPSGRRTRRSSPGARRRELPVHE